MLSLRYFILGSCLAVCAALLLVGLVPTPPHAEDVSSMSVAPDEPKENAEQVAPIRIAGINTAGNLQDNNENIIIYVGESISLSKPVNEVSFYNPIFSADRVIVNPAMPVTDGAEIIFNKPGEYYLTLNNELSIKALVLSADEPISENVVAAFNFLSANSLPILGHETRYYNDKIGYTEWFFEHSEPALLLCGPTHSLFEDIVFTRFALPIRHVTFTGTFLYGGQVKYTTHNVVEIYLPDVKKWVLFDVNNAFYVRWLEAYEIAQVFRDAAGGAVPMTAEDFTRVDWASRGGKIGETVEPYKPKTSQVTAENFSPELLSSTHVKDGWRYLASAFLGGPSYWRSSRGSLPGLGGDHDLYYVTIHDDELLIEASTRWPSNWDMTVNIVTHDEIALMFEEAHREVFDRKLWLEKIHPKQAATLTADAG